jgi:nucleoside-diphosphate-sugar epimerase
MKKILITGVHGFVGGNLVKSISTVNEIYGLDIIFKERPGLKTTYAWDQLDKIEPVDTIVHLAGKAHDTKNQSEARVYFEVNTELTKRIFDYFLKSGAKKFIYFSSVKAAADKVDGVLTEDFIPSPRGPYGESKLAGERYLLDMFSKAELKGGLRDEGTKRLRDKEVQNIESSAKPLTSHISPLTSHISPLTSHISPLTSHISHLTSHISHLTSRLYILRPCMIHGPGNKGNLNQLVKMVKAGIPYPLGAFENMRSFTSIDNLSFVINELINKDIPSGIYNMADDEPVSTNELVRLISKANGKKERIWNINRQLLTSLAAMGSLFHLPFNRDSLQKLTESYVVSNAKIKSALNISRMPVESVDGLTKTIQSLIQTN